VGLDGRLEKTFAAFANILRHGSISGGTRTRASRVVHFTARRSAFSVAARCSTMLRACWLSASAQTLSFHTLFSLTASLPRAVQPIWYSIGAWGWAP